MPVNPDDPQIPVNCAAAPQFDAKSDLCAPELNYGPIRNLYFTRSPFAAPPTALEVARRLALFDTTPTDPEAMSGPFICTVSHDGSGGASTESFNGQLLAKPSSKEYAVTTKETSQKNVNLSETTQRGGLRTRAYGVDSSNYWHGGQTGLGHEVGTLVLGLVIPDGFDTVQEIKGKFTTALGYFGGKRIVSPVPVV